MNFLTITIRLATDQPITKAIGDSLIRDLEEQLKALKDTHGMQYTSITTVNQEAQVEISNQGKKG